MTESRLMLAQIRPVDVLMDLLRGDAIVVNLPSDAKIYRLQYELETDSLLMLISSDSFPIHEPGQLVERINLLCEKREP